MTRISRLGKSWHRLPNPAQQDLRNAKCNFQSNIARHDFRFRSGVTTAADGQLRRADTGAMVQAEFHPMNLDTQGATKNPFATAGCVPTGPAPADSTGVNFHYCGTNSPLGVAKYDALYTRYIVEKTHYTWDVTNREPFDIVVGVTVHPHSAFINESEEVNGVDLGSPIPSDWEPVDTPSLHFMKDVPNTRIYHIKGADYSKTQHNAIQSGETTMNVQGNTKRIELHLDNFDILNQMTRQLGDSHFDITSHSGVFSTLGAPTEHGIEVWLWAMPATAYTNYEGTSATGNDRHGYIEVENFVLGTSKDWTSLVTFGYRCTQEVILFDPIVTLPASIVPDVNTVA